MGSVFCKLAKLEATEGIEDVDPDVDVKPEADESLDDTTAAPLLQPSIKKQTSPKVRRLASPVLENPEARLITLQYFETRKRSPLVHLVPRSFSFAINIYKSSVSSYWASSSRDRSPAQHAA